MFKENQKIPVKWGHTNKKYYESKGYVFTNYGDILFVRIEDLMQSYSGKVDFVCDLCEDDFTRGFYLSMARRKQYYGMDLCQSCLNKISAQKTLKERAKSAIAYSKKICDENGYTLLTTENDYTDNLMYIKFICPKHGIQQVQLVGLKGGHLCRECGYEKVTNMNKLSAEEIEKRINSINNNKLLNPQDYVNDSTKNLRILCGCCGKNVFIISHASYREGTNKCRSCSSKMSKGEYKLYCILGKYDIVYETQKTFEDCRDVNLLPFDSYLPDFNMCIEYDGEQHYRSVFGDDTFEYTKKHDEIKNNYCKEHNIQLIRIPYFEFYNMENIIIKELKL